MAHEGVSDEDHQHGRTQEQARRTVLVVGSGERWKPLFERAGLRVVVAQRKLAEQLEPPTPPSARSLISVEFYCPECQTEFDLPPHGGEECPNCGSTDVLPAQDEEIE